MNKRSEKTIRTWFEGEPPNVKAVAEVDEISGVTFHGDSLTEALNRVVEFMAIDMMEEWGKRNG